MNDPVSGELFSSKMYQITEKNFDFLFLRLEIAPIGSIFKNRKEKKYGWQTGSIYPEYIEPHGTGRIQ
ncbi:MAG: hypothetical protein J6W81_00410 [Lentisphaeria bacterium]|nr:hypothetical protein [Lentisphaeria bacterium]